MKKQQEVEQERYQCEMQRKMDMLVKLKEDMGSIKVTVFETFVIFLQFLDSSNISGVCFFLKVHAVVC